MGQVRVEVRACRTVGRSVVLGGVCGMALGVAGLLVLAAYPWDPTELLFYTPYGAIVGGVVGALVGLFSGGVLLAAGPRVIADLRRTRVTAGIACGGPFVFVAGWLVAGTDGALRPWSLGNPVWWLIVGVLASVIGGAVAPCAISRAP
jgi:hypothetical protein